MPYKVRANPVGRACISRARRVACNIYKLITGCLVLRKTDPFLKGSTNGPNTKLGPESPKDAHSTGLPAQRAGVSLVTQASICLSVQINRQQGSGRAHHFHPLGPC